MPRRGAIAILLTTGALAFLLSFRTPDTGPAARPGHVAAVGQAAPGATTIPAATPAARAAAPPVAIERPRASAPPAATATPGAAPASPGAAAAASYRDGTYTGTGVQIRWGVVQVQVTIAGGAITDVTAVQLPNGDRRTDRISQAVEPMLREEALTVQSGNVDVVSGATYTSMAYAQSLQAALDQAAGG